MGVELHRGPVTGVASVGYPGEKWHLVGRWSVEELVLGLTDGLVSTISVAAGLTGAALASPVMIRAGLAELLGGSLAMGLGAYLSARAQGDFWEREFARERREIVEMPQAEAEEVRQIYARKGFTGPDLERAVAIITADPQVWLGVMMEEELGLSRERPPRPGRSAYTVGLAFATGALIPLIPYFFWLARSAFTLAVGLMMIFLGAVGLTKAVLTGARKGRSLFETIGLGGLAALAAYGLGVWLGRP